MFGAAVIVFCIIPVTILYGSNPTKTKAMLEGNVISQTKHTVTADFSIDAEIQNFVGDYHKVTVNKKECSF